MKGAFKLLLALLTVATASLPLAANAAADQAAQLRPIDLRVSGGEESWHPDNDFRLDWDRPPIADQGFPVTAVDYRVRDAAGTAVVPEIHLPWDIAQIENIHLPLPVPGIYTADVWLEGPGGQRGPRVSAALRFDDVRPGFAQPLPPPGWVAGNVSAIVRIEHPAGAQPASGIRGYAISVDRGGGDLPCATPTRCSLAETDLREGIEGDTISLGILPEGANRVRAVAVSGSGVPSGEVGSAIVRVDATRPTVTLAGAPKGWADGPVRLTATAADAMSGMGAGGPNGAFTAIALEGGVPKVAEGATVTALVSGDGAHTAAFYARDAAGNVGASLAPVAAVRIDESAPAVAFVNRQDPAEPERIEATVADPLSGPDPARGSIAVRRAGSRQGFEKLPTTVSAGRLVARWDSDSFPAGSYEFKATGYDGAGNGGASDRRGNGTRMVLANPLKLPTAIEAKLGSAATRPISSSSSVRFGGRLTLAPTSTRGGLPVRVIETFDPGARPAQRTSTVETAADGTFVAHLSPGPSRRVEVVYDGNPLLGRSGSGELRLRVRAGVHMHASTAWARVGGAPVVFRGRLDSSGAAIPAHGRPVELQFRFAGRGWSEFRTVQTDAHGRFHYPYAFSDDDSRGVRFQFRAFAPAEDGWPYEPAGSKPVFVTGR
jgi:hypothetical protein